MSELRNVELPNGQVIEEVPVGMTRAELMDKLLRNGIVTPEQAQEWGITKDAPAPAGPAPGFPDGLPTNLPIDTGLMPQDPSEPMLMEPGQGGFDAASAAESAGTWLGENLDIPGGIAGSMAGAKAGVPFGPYGILAGTVVGGAIGTFGGELLSDYFMGDELDMGEATKSALITAGVDTATLGVASKFKKMAKAMGFGPDEIADLWKQFTNKATGGTKVKPQALPVGSDASLKQTQNLLEEGGGTLRAYQTGKANTVERISEGVGEVGIVSGAGYRALDDRNAQLIGGRIQSLMDDAVVNPDGVEMGVVVSSIIDGGKEATQKLYDTQLGRVSELVGKRSVNPKMYASAIRRYLKKGQRAWGSEWSDKAVGLANKWLNTLDELPAMTIDDMLALQRKMNDEISILGKFDASPADKQAARHLAILSKNFRDTTEKLLRSKGNKRAYDIYKNANKAYGEAIEGLLPKMNSRALIGAKKGDFESIARVLEGKNPDQIEAFLKSIDTAYDSARKAGVDLAETTGITSAKQARDIVKSGWLKNLFGDVTAEGFDPVKFNQLSSFYERPANARAAKAILGDDWPQFKMLLNAMTESTNKSSGFVGSLVLRGKEAEAIRRTMDFTQGAGAVTAGFMGGPGMAAAVLGTPVLLAKAVTRPAVVRALLDGNKRISAAQLGGKTALVAELTEQLAQQVWNLLPEEDQIEIRNEMRENGIGPGES